MMWIYVVHVPQTKDQQKKPFQNSTRWLHRAWRVEITTGFRAECTPDYPYPRQWSIKKIEQSVTWFVICVSDIISTDLSKTNVSMTARWCSTRFIMSHDIVESLWKNAPEVTGLDISYHTRVLASKFSVPDCRVVFEEKPYYAFDYFVLKCWLKLGLIFHKMAYYYTLSAGCQHWYCCRVPGSQSQ